MEKLAKTSIKLTVKVLTLSLFSQLRVSSQASQNSPNKKQTPKGKIANIKRKKPKTKLKQKTTIKCKKASTK